FAALRRWGELANPDAVLAQCVLAGTVVTTMVVSAFDVVLLLAAPAFMVWSVLGATSGIRPSAREIKMSSAWLGVSAAALVVATLITTTRSVTQLIAMSSVGRGGLTAGWVTGAMWDPGSYRINLRGAQLRLAGLRWIRLAARRLGDAVLRVERWRRFRQEPGHEPLPLGDSLDLDCDRIHPVLQPLEARGLDACSLGECRLPAFPAAPQEEKE